MKYVLDLSDVFMDDDGNTLYKAKGFNSLVFDDTGISKLEKFDDIVKNYMTTARSDGYNVGVYEYSRMIEYIKNYPVRFKTFLTGIGVNCKDANTFADIIMLINDYNSIYIVSKFNEWVIKKSDEESPDTDIKIGDVVINGRNGDMVVVVSISNDKNYYTVMDNKLNIYDSPKVNLTRTGKNYGNEINTLISAIKKD